LQFQEVFAVASGRLPSDLEAELSKPLQAYAESVENEYSTGAQTPGTSEVGVHFAVRVAPLLAIIPDLVPPV
jgi:hypothetical protein